MTFIANTRRCLAFASLMTLMATCVLAVPCIAQEPSFNVQGALTTYCTSCHGADKQKSERRFDQLRFPLEDNDSLALAQEIIDELVLEEMPPKEAKQPAPRTRQALIRSLREQMAIFRESSESVGGETVLRRLNRREYRNTVRDLLNLDMQMFDPTRKFPRDQAEEHFDNVGNTLVTTGFLLEQYLFAADQVIEKALSPETKPAVQTWRFKAPFQQQPELTFAQKEAHGSKYLCLLEAINSMNHFGEYAPILKFKEGVPHNGRYEIRVLAEAKNRKHAHPVNQVSIDQDEPMWMGVVPGNFGFGELHQPQPFEKVLAKLEVPDGKPQWLTSEVRLDKGFTPRFIYINGPSRVRDNMGRLGLELIKKKGVKNDRFGRHYAMAMKFAELPHIRIHEIQIKGPLYDQWPPESHQAILGDKAFSRESASVIISAFMNKAYRRQATLDELKGIFEVARRSLAAGRTPYESMKDALKAVLCSPAFLYLDEQTVAPSEARLSDLAFANRLAYFLWSSMPDEKLLAAVRDQSIRNPQKLQSEVARMLQDPRANAFFEGFTDSWLMLRDLGTQPPDRKTFADRIYYEKNLRPLMREETQLFVRHLMEENLSLLNFLDSDFTFANKTLAQFYKLPPMQGYDFRKVTLNTKKRGGLLGHASVLTVTANGIETSPVTRGVWVLGNLFGSPPPPPPDDVEPLDPDIRGATTVREQLAKHRSVAACNECHQKIDPLGFALENFDVIGRYRWNYKDGNGPKIDSSGAFPNGDSFEDVVGLKMALLDRKDQFTRALIEKLMIYGTGRQMEIADRPEIDRLQEEFEQNDYRLRDGLMSVIQSSVFQSR